jgi:hypothetical protein
MISSQQEYVILIEVGSEEFGDQKKILNFLSTGPSDPTAVRDCILLDN